MLGNYAEQKKVLTYALKLRRERGDNDEFVARALSVLSDANRMLGFVEEGIPQAREALEIYQRIGTTAHKVRCLNYLTMLLLQDGQLNAAKEAASQAIDLLPEKGQEFLACVSQRLLGDVYKSKGGREKASFHFAAALAIASPFGWQDELFWIHCGLAEVFLDECEFDKAHIHLEQAESHAVTHPYNMGRATELQARAWFRQNRLKEAMSEALRASETYGKLGASSDLEDCRVLQSIEGAIKRQFTPDNSDSNGECLSA